MATESPTIPPAISPPPDAASSAAPPAIPEEEEIIIETSIWQHPFVQNVLPFLTSLVLHLSVIAIGMLTVEAVRTAVLAPPREQIIVPDADMVDNIQDAGIEHPGLGGDPTRDAAQDKFPDVPKDSKGVAEKPGTNLLPAMMGGGDGEAATIGIGAGVSIGAGKGKGVGSGDGDGSGVLAPFGIPGGGGGIGPKARFIGLGGTAKRIAYVCDASGSMLNMFDSLRMEIRKSVEGLRVIQSFNLIFFQDQGYATVEKAGLLPATPDNKAKAFEFLDKFFVRGETNPIPALELAFSQKPELIYLLTDGDFSGPGNDVVIAYIRKMTSDGRTKINTIAFVPRDSKDNPQDLAFIRVLKEIASSTGGNFKQVSDEDMGQVAPQ